MKELLMKYKEMDTRENHYDHSHTDRQAHTQIHTA